MRQHLLGFAPWLLTLSNAFAQGSGCQAPPGADGSAAEIVALSGQGQARADGAAPWAAAALAQRLPPGAEVRTLALSSAALLLADRTQIRLAAQAQVRLCDARPAQTRLELAVGRLWARAKGQGVNVELRTPAVLAAVRGTDWDVEVDAQGRTTLTVLSGRIDVSNAQGAVVLGPAEQAVAEPGQAPVKRLLVRPRERVQWVMAPALTPPGWPELADATAPDAAWRAPALQALRAGRLAALREQVDARLRAQPADPLAQRLRAETEVAEGQLGAAQQRLLQVWHMAGDAAAAARRAALLLALEQGDAARAFIAQARAQAPHAVALLLVDADARRLDGDAGGALALYRQAAAQARGTPEEGAALAGLGRALRERGDLAAARAALAQAVQRQPHDADTLAQAATADAQALRFGAAAEGFGQALAQAGDDYVALAGAGLLALQRGQSAAARELLLKALVIEPRYAQAQVWLAVAEYRLGQAGAAFDALERARQADPRDPLPWQIAAVLHNDAGEPEQAVAAAREALARLPYLKSLNPLASDSQGSASLGKALADFGLEHWARAYVQQSYYPLWAGSHFFLANRYESEYARMSELYQGYLSDPTVFGASEKHPGVFLTALHEASLGLSGTREALRNTASADAGLRGFSAAPLPLAWLLRTDGVVMQPRDGPPGSLYRMHAPQMQLALGVRPTDRLGLFAMVTEGRMRYRFPWGLDFGNGITFSDTARYATRRGDFGGSWRWSADAQTWFKLHRVSDDTGLSLDDAQWGPQAYTYRSQEYGLYLRHTAQTGALRWSLGWESVRRSAGSDIRDDLVASPRTNLERYDMPWAALEWAHGPWRLHAATTWPRLRFQEDNAYRDSLTGEDLLEPASQGTRLARQLRPRLGASYRWGPGRALHWAWQESLHAPGTHTLAPVATGAIPIDYQYQLPGSLARKHAVQLDWELGPRSFATASLAQQEIRNPRMADGRLYGQAMGALFDYVGTLAPAQMSAQTQIDPYQGTPRFGHGRLHQAGVALNQVLAPRWSLLASYAWADARNLGAGYEGLRLPGVPRHTAVLGSTWRHTGRGYTVLGMVYRGGRFADEANTQAQAPGWTVSLAHALESPSREWALYLSAQQALQPGEKPVLWALLRWRPGSTP
jgi:hypothetical protein